MTLREDLKLVGLVAFFGPPIGLFVWLVGKLVLWPEHHTLRTIIDNLAGYPVALIFAYPLGIVPAAIGGAILCIARRRVPEPWQTRAIARFAIGALLGGLIGYPAVMAIYHSSDIEPRVYALSMLVGIVTGGVCALQFGRPRARLLATRSSGP